MNERTDPDSRALARAGDTRHPAFLRVARRYTRRRISRRLDGLWVSGLDEARAALAGRPLIFAANHVAWWDALLLLPLDEALGGLGWAVMDARNLRRLPFLGWVGALPLDRSSPERSRGCLQACAALLDRPGRALWIFPQGRQRPAHLRPLDLRPGVQTLHATSGVDLVAVSIDYVFLERPRPAAIVRFCPPISGADTADEALLPAVEGAILDGLAVIDAAVREATDGRRARTHPHDPLPGFTPLVRPARLLPARRSTDGR
ncbi:lysophospholipid acyltransferase family protein [Mycolicibacterium sp.]|uniref:lysophospholipid acyltransferase family protein n=1 Tax=Mycolicibacterium sp. TaxID=2320850 RepID=UPI0028A6425B|nr:lysophospholipid acyltransferase family protein [Mycolicibacterium sp.]